MGYEPKNDNKTDYLRTTKNPFSKVFSKKNNNKKLFRSGWSVCSVCKDEFRSRTSKICYDCQDKAKRERLKQERIINKTKETK